ncbi:MAG: hypothetical protein IK124_06230 [Prevotella sp.]|nr:hypothetical protein [Prevotella sp.]
MKKAKLFMMLALLVMGVSYSFAQHVTIRPDNGSLVGSLSEQSETGFKAGWNCLWRHEQLALSLTGSDEADLDEYGNLARPKACLGEFNDQLIIAGGHRSTYLTVSLPKGYRITGYRIVLVNDLVNTDICPGNTDVDNEFHSANALGNNYMRFIETVPSSLSTGSYNEGNINNVGVVIEQALAADGDGAINCSEADRNKEYVIERTAKLQDDGTYDMDNILYFRLLKTYYYYAISIKSFDIYFTSEGTFTANVQPKELNETAVSMTTSEFKTSKIDIGALSNQSQPGTTVSYFCYDYNHVENLSAYNYLYQWGDENNQTHRAVQNGAPADVASVKKIYSTYVGGEYFYGLKNGIYFVEPPIEVTTNNPDENKNKAPIGFRIVGAQLYYSYGKSQTAGTEQKTYDTFTIQSTVRISRVDRTIWLTSSGSATQTEGSAAAWFMDDQGHIRTEGGTYLVCSPRTGNSTVGDLSTTTNVNSASVFSRDANNRIIYSYNNRSYILQGQAGNNNNPSFRFNYNSTSNLAQATNTGSQVTIEIEGSYMPAFTPEDYTIKVYGAEGNLIKTIDVNSSVVGTKSYDLGVLNNDAIKFEIEGVDDGMALVYVDLQLQALDPYIDKMDIVCHDPLDQFTLTQTFTADDFSVAGGAFKFYVPTSKANSLLTLTFKDLYSKYGDETYPSGGEGSARYSYVTSEYFIDHQDIYADPESVWSSPSDNKILTSTAGNARFKFNNAENLSNTGEHTGNEYLEEYQFNLDTYLNNYDDPDGKVSDVDSIACQLMAVPTSDEYQKAGTFYVFTADETRYNIAPTTAWQHRFYAFYRMDIELIAEDFTAAIEPFEVYKKTFYGVSSSDMKESAQYGVKLTTNQKITIDDGNGGTKESYGYLSAKQIIDAVEDLDGIDKDQILFVDASDLLNIVELTEEGESTATPISQIKDGLGPNVLVYLPEKTTSTLDNFAFMSGTVSGKKVFRAGKDIVITDRYPFFSPYNIQLAAEGYIMYDRALTPADGYSNIVNASVILPFTITTNNKGEFTSYNSSNQKVGNTITLSTMNSGKALSKDNTEYDNEAKGYFTNITGKSVANKPYIVTVDGKQTDDYNFNVRVKGETIVATGDPYATAYDSETSGIFTGSESTGTVNGTSYTLTPTGTFMGKEIASASTASPAIFYFSKDCFVTTRTLGAGKSLKILPFRSFYEYPEPVATSSGAKMTKFRIVFGENLDDDNTTAINDAIKDADLAVIPGKGTITLMARADKDVTIHAVSGITVDKCNLRAGDTRTVAVPAGVYVINGVKMIVK